MLLTQSMNAVHTITAYKQKLLKIIAAGEKMNVQVIIIMVAIAVGLLITMKLMLSRLGETAGYESRAVLYTPVERSFLAILEQALDSRYRVFGKVRLGDLIKPANGLDAGKRTAAQNRINQKHVDFVVCTANELALVGVLALDDKSHGHEDRPGRGGFVDQALAMAGIPLLRFPAKNVYAIQDVRARLAEMMLAGTRSGVVSAIGPLNPELEAIMESYPAQPDSSAPACPKCAATMVKRQAVRGHNAGSFFWACSTFPMCRQLVQIGEG